MALLCRTYRSRIVALLLALYGFVAMPVQWWHHHAECGYSQGVHGKQAGHCEMCDHQHAAYYDNRQVPVLILPATAFFIRVAIAPQLTAAPHASSANKGPPVIS